VRKTSSYPIDPLFLERKSIYDLSGEALTDEELFPLFEAARFAPSSYNNQPWIFIYAHRGTPQWDPLFNLLVDFNKEWCKNSAVLVLIASRNTFASGKFSRTHSFDTGSAWMSFALEGTHRGYVVHGMEGFNYDRAYELLKIPKEGYTVEAMAAVGKKAASGTPSKWQEKDQQTKPRKALSEFVMLGHFSQSKVQVD
jgi:nitroreductase